MKWLIRLLKRFVKIENGNQSIRVGNNSSVQQVSIGNVDDGMSVDINSVGGGKSVVKVAIRGATEEEIEIETVKLKKDVKHILKIFRKNREYRE